MQTPHPDTKTSIVANFVYTGQHDKTLSSATLPALPRVGDMIKRSRPDSTVYTVKAVTFEVPEDDGQRATILVTLESPKKIRVGAL